MCIKKMQENKNVLKYMGLCGTILFPSLSAEQCSSAPAKVR